MTDKTTPVVEQREAIAFCNEAFRNTDWIDTIDAELLEDVQGALTSVVRRHVQPAKADALRTLLHESLYHLRLDDAAKAFHDKVLAALQSTPEQPSGEPVGAVERVTKAILFQDSGSTEGWEDNTSLGEAAIAAMPKPASEPVDPENACANCKGMIGDLARGRDPEELCDTCYADSRATPQSPTPASPSLDEVEHTPDLAHLIGTLRALEAKATPGPWDIDSEYDEDALYSGGGGCGRGFKNFFIGADVRGKWATLFDSVNSDEKLIEEDYDEDGCSAWDATGHANAALIVALRNALPTILAALSAPASATSDRERIVAWLRDSTNHRHPDFAFARVFADAIERGDAR